MFSVQMYTCEICGEYLPLEIMCKRCYMVYREKEGMSIEETCPKCHNSNTQETIYLTHSEDECMKNKNRIKIERK